MLKSRFNKFIGLQACNFTKRRLQRRPFPVIIVNSKITYFQKHLQRAGSDSSYILHRKLITLFRKRIGLPDWPFASFETLYHCILLTLIRIHSFYHSLSFAITHCYFLLLVVICCHSLSLAVPLVVTRCITRCHSLYHSMPFVVTRCHSLYHLL